MVFDFNQFWLEGRPGNEYFWISHKISGLLTPLTPMGVYPQWLLKMKSETESSNSSQCAFSSNSFYFIELRKITNSITKITIFPHGIIRNIFLPYVLDLINLLEQIIEQRSQFRGKNNESINQVRCVELVKIGSTTGFHNGLELR